MREADVRDQAVAEKCRDAPARAVDELIGNHEIQRLVLFLERAHRAERKNALHAQRFHAPDVGAEIQLRWREAMPRPCRARNATSFPASLPTTYLSEGSPNGVPTRRSSFCFKSRHRIQPAAADNSDCWFHACINSR